MKLKSAYFKNLAGVFRGSGKKEIFIDFTKCKHNIILITGKNGAGKSTIFNALHFLPDNHSMYIPGEPGEKIIEYYMNDTIYKFRIIYPLTTNKTRGQTKAFFSKIINGKEIEYNPNGNIGSYKDRLYKEFDLDPAFVSLSQLSSDNRGLADKNPAERKKFVSNIIDSIEVYNDIYKSLSKKSTELKSLINNLTAKIDVVGNEDSIRNSLNSINKRISKLKDRELKMQKKLSEYEANIKIMDPNGNIQSLYNKLYNELEKINKDIESNNILIMNISNQKYTSDLDSSLQNYNNIKDIIYKISINIDGEKERLSNFLLSKEEDMKILKIKREKLNSLKSEFNYNELMDNINILRINIKKYKEIFNKIGIENFNITKEEYISGINILKDLQNQILNVKSYYTNEEINESIDCILENRDILNTLNTLNNNKNLYLDDINTKKEKLIYYESLLKTKDILKNRPSNCSIDTCAFIKSALDANEQRPEENISLLNKNIDDLNTKLSNCNESINRYTNILQINQSLNVVLRNLNNNVSILKKLPYTNKFINIKELLNKIKYGDKFEEINKLYGYIDYANILEEYKNDKYQLDKLESELKLYKSKQSIVDELNDELFNLDKKLSNISDKIYESQDKINKLEKDKINNEKILINIEKCIDIFKINKGLLSKKTDIELRLSNIANNMKTIEDCIYNINNISSDILNISNELKPLDEEKNSLLYSLTQLKEYKEELSIYHKNYEIVDIIRKYSSPTKGGIQNIFMNIYMNKTLSFANKLLSILFDGDLELLPYIINDKEFRIPVKDSTSSLINDDIHSCSTSQICMISMILSFSLLHQSSTTYNIIKLDEIDGGLDYSNRSKFPIVLNRIMNYLNVEHCVMVSHSSEMDISNVDIISLNPVGDTPQGNVIFSY